MQKERVSDAEVVKRERQGREGRERPKEKLNGVM